MLRLMVQGDRDAKGIEDAVRQLGELCKERGIGLNVGEAGQIVRLLAETGAHVRVHQAKPERPNVPGGFTGEIVDCYGSMQQHPAREFLHVIRSDEERQRILHRASWGLRLACLDASDGFIFFPGREGTLAHLVPIMAFIVKGEVDKGVTRPRRIAFVGYSASQIVALRHLLHIQIMPLMAHPTGLYRGRRTAWCARFNAAQIAQCVNWITDGLTIT